MSFWFALLYLVVEYMRPQSMYEGLSGLPLGSLVVAGMIFFFFLEKQQTHTAHFQNQFIMAFFFWILVSSAFAYKPDVAWKLFLDFGKWIVIYFLLIHIVNDKKKLYLFLLVFLILNFKYSQYAVRVWVANGFYSDPRGLYEGGGIGSGFFKNPNDFGVALNSVFGLSYYLIAADTQKQWHGFKMRWFHLATTLSIPLAILSTSSRGAAVAFGGVVLGIWIKSRRKMIALFGVLIAAISFIVLIPDDNWRRFENMGDKKDATSQSRLDLWRAGLRMANENPITGVGPNNFPLYNMEQYGNAHGTVPHNIFIQALSELGYPGLILFIAMILGCFYNQRNIRRLLIERQIDDPFLYWLSHGLDISLIGFMVNGFFITVLYYPFFWMLLTLGVVSMNILRQLPPGTRESPDARPRNDRFHPSRGEIL